MSSPFALSQAGAPARSPRRFSFSPALLVFLGCVLVGLGLVAWRANTDRRDLEARARAEVLARATLVQSQFNDALSAAELLGLLAQQNGGTVPNFQKVAGNLLAAHPGIAWIENQPGGRVKEIIPKAGLERATGLNVLEHPLYRPGAAATLERRALTVAGPVALYSGEPGIIARFPIFLRGRSGGEAFRGFVAVSVRLRDALLRSGIDRLWNEGFAYALVLPSPGKQRPTLVSSRGNISLADSVPEHIRAQNLDLLLTLKPRGGWFNLALLATEVVGVLILSALCALMVKLYESRHGIERTLMASEQRLAREAAERKKSDETCSEARNALGAAQAQLQAAKVELESSNASAVQLQTRLEAVVRDSSRHTETSQAALKAAQDRCLELEKRLQSTTPDPEAVRDRQQALQRAQEKSSELQKRFETESSARKHEIAQLEGQLQNAEKQISGLQARLEAAVRDRDESAQSAQQRLQAAEEKSRKLLIQLEAADKRAAQIPELTKPLDEKAAELERLKMEALPAGTDLPNPELAPVSQLRFQVSGFRPPSSKPGEAPASARSKRKRRTRDDQIDLFGAEPAEKMSKPAASADNAAPLSVPNQNEIGHEPVTATVPQAVEPATENSEEIAEKSMDSASNEGPADSAEVVAVETESPSHIEEFASVAGLDCSEGLSRAGSDPKVYLKALQSFAHEQLHVPDEIRDALVQGESTGAVRLVHGLQKAAEVIGATRVQAAASLLSDTMNKHSDPAEIEFVWVDLEKAVRELGEDLKPLLPTEEDKPAAPRRLRTPPPVDLGELRAAAAAMFPLLVDGDPGARDCLKDNRHTFRSTFSPEAYLEFEQEVKSRNYAAAAEHLRKAVRKHGINV